jgi:hypothetical protein
MISEFNSFVNSILDPINTNVYFNGFLKIFLILYGTLAAPRISPSVAHIFSHSLFRLTVMALIVWVYTSDPALSILIAIMYFTTMTYITKNVVEKLYTDGEVSSELASVISGGDGPGIKTDVDKETDATLIQNSLDITKEPISVEVVADITQQPIETVTQSDELPQPPPMAFMPDDSFDLAKTSEE